MKWDLIVSPVCDMEIIFKSVNGTVNSKKVTYGFWCLTEGVV